MCVVLPSVRTEVFISIWVETDRQLRVGEVTSHTSSGQSGALDAAESHIVQLAWCVGTYRKIGVTKERHVRPRDDAPLDSTDIKTVNTTSLNGFNYSMNFVNEYSRFAHIYFMRSKTAAESK